MLASPLAVMAAREGFAAGKMTLSMHQQTSAAAGYQKSLEGWARAGIKNVELTAASVDAFVKTDSLPAARRLLTDLGDAALFVPTTTRTRKQYQRINLPGPPPKYAVCANGGHLLVDGATDHDWHARVLARLADECAPLAEVQEYLAKTADPLWLRKQRVAEDLFAYLVVERELLPEEWVKELAAWAENRGWTVSLQGRKI